MNTKILNTAKTIFKETNRLGTVLPTSNELSLFIKNYEKNNQNNSAMLEVMEKITDDGYNIDGFCLYDRPKSNVYVFYNDIKNQMFDIYVQKIGDNKYKAKIGYIDSNDNQCTTLKIETAIKNYNPLFLQ